MDGKGKGSSNFLDREVFRFDLEGNNKEAEAPNETGAVPWKVNWMSQQRFFDFYWQREPFHFARDPDALNDVFGIEDMEELWSNAMRSVEASDPNTLLIFSAPGRQCGAVLQNPFFAFAHRCSVVVNRSERFSAPLLRLCTSLEETFPFAFVNLYVTPPGSQSVPRHSDDREVLLLQVFGEKEWTVYNAPVELPYKHEEVGKTGAIEDSLLTVKLRCTVKKGDILYLPRGAVHEGKTSAESSVHLTVALQSSDWDLNTMLFEAMKHFVHNGPSIGRPCLPRDLLKIPPSTTTAAPPQPPPPLAEQFALLKSLFAGSAESELTRAIERFQERIHLMRVERLESCFGKKLSKSSASDDDGAEDQEGRGTLGRLPLPLTRRSLIMWNVAVELDEIQEIPQVDPKMPQLSHIVRCSRRQQQQQSVGGESDETCPRDRMAFATSVETIRVVQMLYSRHRMSPVEVRHLGLFDELANLSIAKVLIGNTSCIRVS